MSNSTATPTREQERLKRLSTILLGSCNDLGLQNLRVLLSKLIKPSTNPPRPIALFELLLCSNVCPPNPVDDENPFDVYRFLNLAPTCPHSILEKHVRTFRRVYPSDKAINEQLDEIVSTLFDGDVVSEDKRKDYDEREALKVAAKLPQKTAGEVRNILESGQGPQIIDLAMYPAGDPVDTEGVVQQGKELKARGYGASITEMWSRFRFWKNSLVNDKYNEDKHPVCEGWEQPVTFNAKMKNLDRLIKEFGSPYIVYFDIYGKLRPLSFDNAKSQGTLLAKWWNSPGRGKLIGQDELLVLSQQKKDPFSLFMECGDWRAAVLEYNEIVKGFLARRLDEVVEPVNDPDRGDDIITEKKRSADEDEDEDPQEASGMDVD